MQVAFRSLMSLPAVGGDLVLVAPRSLQSPARALAAEGPSYAVLPHPHLSEGCLAYALRSWALTWFFPTTQQVELETAICRAEEFGLNDARSLEEFSARHTGSAMAEPVPVVRAYGPIGFFWALVLDRLSERRAHNNCSACGRVLPARRGRRRRYCTKVENPDCFDQRQRERQRRSRGRNRLFSTVDRGPA